MLRSKPYTQRQAPAPLGFKLAIIFFLWSLAYACGPRPNEVDLPDTISFNFDIRPILSNNCYVCHGPDSSTRQADFRLDLREYATRRLADGWRAIAPGSWRKSKLIHRVSSFDPEEMMPPPEMKRRLSAKEIAMLKRWINQGAKWEPYWAFISPSGPVVPEVNEGKYVNNEIDNFIVSKLTAHQLSPAKINDKPGLVRRLSYTLTGLPPKPEIVSSFIDDNSTDAYEKLIDHYLDSKHFGEQWARHWMDLVRYADSRGHEFDYDIIGAWQYRDYLIRAFNEDIPYNQLVLEHLAGDLLTNPRVNNQQGYNESVIGTAFYCLTEGKHSPVDLKKDESERIDNIIDVTSKTFQALTVSCAKCHDHKFDPIPTTDYYSLYGIVESTRFTLIPAGFNLSKQLTLDSLKRDQLQIRKYIAENISESSQTDLYPGEDGILSGSYSVIGDFRDGTLNDWTPYGMAFTNALGHPVVKGNQVVGLENGKASSKVLGKGLYGVLRSPGFIISEDSLLVRAAGEKSIIRVIIDNFQLIQDPIYGQLQIHVQSEDLEDHRIDLSMWKGHRAYIELLVGDYQRRKDKDYHQYDLDASAWLEVAYVLAYDSLTKETGFNIKSFKTSKPLPKLKQSWVEDHASSKEIMMLNQWFTSNKPVIKGLNQWQQQQSRRAGALYDTTFVVGVTDGDHIQSPVFIRGSHQNLSQTKVQHRFLTAISDTAQVFEKVGSGRLEWANHIISKQNPLTARVMVNRIWHHIFGTGIVKTVDNFGVQGKIPSHPKLLDHLAVKFVDAGWSVKRIIKYLVMSQTFQRVTKPSKASQVVDPENLLLQHYPVRRINAESIRDAVLAASGRLDTTMYGPPVPTYLTEFLEGRGRPKRSGPLDGAGRRSVYQQLKRNFLPPMMLAFDMPVPFSTFGRRNVSNVPSQSLIMLNSPFIAAQASIWASQLLKEPGSFEERLKKIYMQAFSRMPEDHEIKQARDFFKQQQVLMVQMRNDQHIPMELWNSYCHSVYNMKEFIFLI